MCEIETQFKKRQERRPAAALRIRGAEPRKGKAMITVQDYIENNDDIRIRIARKHSRDINDPLTSTIWEGMLYDTPEELRKLEVLSEGWMMEARINQLEVFMGQ